MIPVTTLKALKACLLIASTTCCIPYQWDGKNNKIIPINNRFKLFLWKISTLIHLLYGIFVLLSFMYHRYNPNSHHGHQEAMYHCLMAVNFITSNVISLNYVIRRKESLLFLNSLLQFNERNQDKLNVVYGVRPGRDYFGLILLSLIPSTLFNNVIFGVLFLMFPSQPQYIYSYLGLAYNNWKLMLPFAINESFQAFHCAFTCFFFVYTSLVFEKSMCKWLQHILKVKDYDVSTMHTYRCLEFLKALHNRAYRDVVTPVFFGASMALLIFSCYGAVRFYNTIPLPGYLLLPVMFAIMCVFSVLLHHSSGNVYSLSLQFISSGKRSADVGVRKMFKTLYSLKIYVGGAYFVRKDSIVTFIDGFTTHTVSLLLTF